MPLRGDRIHRYVNAFCPLCHEERPGPPAGRGAPALRLAGRARRPDLAGARVSRPRPGAHAVRRVAGDPPLPRAVDRADEGAHARPARQLRCRCPRRTQHGLPEMQTQHTCILLRGPARPLQPQVPDLLRRVARRPSRRSRRWSRCWRRSTPGSPARTAGSTCSCSAAASRRSTRGSPSCSTPWPRGRSCGCWSTPTASRIAQDDELLALLHATPRAGRGLPPVRRGVRRGLDPPPGRRHPAVQGARDRAAVRRGRLHHAHDDGGARRQRRRDRLRGQAGAGHAVRRRGHHPAGVRLRPLRRRSTRSTGSRTPASWPGSTSRPPAQVTWRDLTALPCSHPHCCSVGYLLRDDSGTWRSLVALIGHDRLKQWLDLEPDLLANRIADDAIPDSSERS